MQHKVHERLANWAADFKTLARQLVSVKTGHLRRSIYAKIGEWVAEVGAEATYAMFVVLFSVTSQWDQTVCCFKALLASIRSSDWLWLRYRSGSSRNDTTEKQNTSTQYTA